MAQYGLGIDTGGTYTDAVIYDFNTGAILHSAKSITIKENLTLGITNTLNGLSADKLAGVKLVSLSTTLATNACVEGKGGRAVLIMIRCDGDIVERYGHQYGLPPAKDIIFLEGGHNQQGEAEAEPDWNLLRERVNEVRSRTDAFAVVELWGIRNPEYEAKAKDLIVEWTGRPVVCGHELTAEINSLKRAASALLNAQLLPLVNDFMNAVKDSLKEKGIDAPLVIVRGDGSLMKEEFAREKPVETLLSGPAASVAGGIQLSGEKDCIVVDMGGTTSDIAIVKDGMAKLAQEGVDVGHWRTGTKSIQITTLGLGGDSMISFNDDNEVLIGPVRVAPLSWLASKWPVALEEIRLLYESKRRHSKSLCQFFYLVRELSEDSYFTDEEFGIVRALKAGPLSISVLAEAVNSSIYDIPVKRLEKLGIILRSALTPTDIMHISGHFSGWSTEAAVMGARIMAGQLGIGMEELVQAVDDKMKEKLFLSIVRLLVENEKEDLLKGGMTGQFSDLVAMSFGKSMKCGKYVNCSFTTNLALVGIGAPIHIYLPEVAKALQTRCIIPENAGVANAVGAITGNVNVEEEVVVKPLYEVSGITGYFAYSSAGRRKFKGYDEALEWAKTEAARLAEDKAVDRGAGQVSTFVNTSENTAMLLRAYANENVGTEEEGGSKKTAGEAQGNTLLLETIVTARAIGALKWM